MKALGSILLSAALLSAGCARSPIPSANDAATVASGGQAPESAAGGATSAKPRFSYINTGDVRARPQLLSGWYGIEDGAWRWMGKEAQALLLAEGAPSNFELRLFFPENHLQRAGGPITVTVLLDGKPLGKQTYSRAGGYAFTQPVPAGTLKSSSATVTIRLDRAVLPGDADKRELGAVVQGFGLAK